MIQGRGEKQTKKKNKTHKPKQTPTTHTHTKHCTRTISRAHRSAAEKVQRQSWTWSNTLLHQSHLESCTQRQVRKGNFQFSGLEALNCTWLHVVLNSHSSPGESKRALHLKCFWFGSPPLLVPERRSELLCWLLRSFLQEGRIHNDPFWVLIVCSFTCGSFATRGLLSLQTQLLSAGVSAENAIQHCVAPCSAM